MDPACTATGRVLCVHQQNTRQDKVWKYLRSRTQSDYVDTCVRAHTDYNHDLINFVIYITTRGLAGAIIQVVCRVIILS